VTQVVKATSLLPLELKKRPGKIPSRFQEDVLQQTSYFSATFTALQAGG
jgi:hypothetical protein